MLINCAIGENSAKDVTDDALMGLIHIACIACGGYAGDENTVSYYQKLAAQNGVKAAAYLSYPDKEHFGMEDMALSDEQLLHALEEQAARFGAMECVKFQGALFTQLNRSAELADLIVGWLEQKGVRQVIAPYRSMLHKACAQASIEVIFEAFADKVYTSMTIGMEPMSSKQIGTTIEDRDKIVRQVRKLKQGVVQIDGQNFLIEADTVCVDRSSAQVLQTVQAILNVL